MVGLHLATSDHLACLALYEDEKLSMTEIGEMLGFSKERVRVCVAKAIRLRKLEEEITR